LAENLFRAIIVSGCRSPGFLYYDMAIPMVTTLHRKEIRTMDNVEMPARSDTQQANRWTSHTVLGTDLTSALGNFCYETSNVILPK
jgi:hypothetical protein